MSITQHYRRRAQALGSYPGSKKKLIDFVFQPILNHFPLPELNQLTLLEPFTGGGGFTLFAKLLGFQYIYANDLSFRSTIIGQAILENDTDQLSKEEVLYLLQPIPGDGSPRFVQTQYCPSVFSTRHAKVLDQTLYWISQIQGLRKRALYRLLLWQLITDFVAFGTSIGTSNRPYAECLDGIRDWDSLNPKRYEDGSIANLLRPIAPLFFEKQKRINRGIFKGAPVTMSQLDAIEFVSQASGDIVYFDPPYAGTLSYESTHRVLDTVLAGEFLPPAATSPYTQSTDILNGLFESSRHLPFWAISYGNLELSLEELVRMVQRHVPGREVTGYAKAYTHMRHVSKRTDNQELLVIAAPKKEVISYDPRH